MNRIIITSYLLIFIHYIYVSNAILNPIDFYALQSIRRSLSDLPGSAFFATWDFSGDPCSFSGVFCDGDRVSELTLGDPSASSPGLSGHLSPSLGRLSSLSSLSLLPGRVVGPLPDTLSDLKNLRFLGISRNFISGEVPAGFGRLLRLRTLDLSCNRLNGTVPDSIGSLPELTNLVLGHNQFTGRLPVFVSQNLNRIDFKRNNLTGTLSPVHFPGSIEYLSLSSNRFEGPIDELLIKLNKLNYLDLSSNRFTGGIPTEVFTFPLTALQLNRNFFYGAVKPVNQVTIPNIDLSYNRFYGEVSPMLSTVQNLYLNNNRFTGLVPGRLVDRLLASRIQTLYLQHNFLTGIEISPRAEIPLSSSLCLQYNCMVPPVQAPCPLKAGTEKARPTSQCIEWRG